MEKRTFSRVKSDTDSSKLAGYLAFVFERGDQFHDLHCIGPASVNQAAKAVASAKGMLSPKGIRILIDPSFFQTTTEARTDSDDKQKTGLKLRVETLL